jgi:hypothetical protein
MEQRIAENQSETMEKARLLCCRHVGATVMTARETQCNEWKQD